MYSKHFDGRAEGRAEGEQIGEARGIEKGEKIGIEKGKEEERARAYQEKIESAQRFLAMGFSVEQVAQGTGLSLDEVRSLVVQL